MLLAHLVPGYFAVVKTQSHWQTRWNRNRRIALWGAALFSTFAPDLDVIYNGLFRGFVNHSTLWTHSLFVHLGIAFGWVTLRFIRRWQYLQTLVGLVAVGGLSHLLLDTIAHGTVLLYPFSLHVFVAPFSLRVLEGGLFAYLTDPLFLVEIFLLMLPFGHVTTQLKISLRSKKLALAGLFVSYTIFVILFLAFLPTLQLWAEPYYG